MSKFGELLGRWNRKLDESTTYTETEHRLVTSRRAFLGLLGGAAAYAASTSPVVAALEVFEPLPAIVPVGPREGFLEVMIGDHTWVSLGQVHRLELIMPEPIVHFGIGGFHTRQSHRSPEIIFEIVHDQKDGILDSWATIQSWMDSAFHYRPGSDYKRPMRLSSLGVDTNFEGCFPTSIEHQFNLDQYGKATMTLEVSVDNYGFKFEKDEPSKS